MANIRPTANNSKQHGVAKNAKLKLESLVRSVGANLQAIIHIINCLQIEKGWQVEKLEKRQPILFKYNSNLKSPGCRDRSLDH